MFIGGLIFLPAEALKIGLAVLLHRRFRKAFLTAVLAAALAGTVPLSAQSKSELSRVRNEIQQLEREIQTKEAKEVTLLEQLQDVERKIGLQKQLTDALKRETLDKAKAVEDAEQRVRAAVHGFETQKAEVAKRMVSMYKRGPMRDWEALASMRSLNQALVWIKYQKIILKNDDRNLRLLVKKEMDVRNQRSELERELTDKQKLLKETNAETANLENNKEYRKQLLSRVRREKEPLVEALEQKRNAYREIENWIAREEERREEEQRREAEKRRLDEKKHVADAERRNAAAAVRRVPQTSTPVAELNRQLAWPVKGKVVSRYGRYMDPELRIWTENFGIEIEAKEGEAVKSVAPAQVKRVEWIRGMGNMVFLDHGGFYTIYGHLERVAVAPGQEIPQGSEIGRIGDRGGFYGTTLHFEVWKGKNHYNPEKWLK
jgi:septal ring factor EnvC (AmiA/AmiB activator)